MVATMKTSNRWLGLLGAVAVMFSASVLASSSSSQECQPGMCDEQNNKAECGYDSGDCCSCTCVDTVFNTCGEVVDFQCVDPAAACVDDDDVTIEQLENCGYVRGIGNGYCDTENNNALCGYDGGDCCSCTCVNTADDDYGCGEEFQCIDPAAPCVDDDDITVDQVENCGYPLEIGNGYCDQENNNEPCNYDGGDCCECTCVAQTRTDDSSDDYNRGCGSGFQCIDPTAPCVDDDDITVGHVDTCDTENMSDAYCDKDNNRPECNYDGGDCCSCTCFDTPNQECGAGYSGFACIDPDAQCVDDDDVTVDKVEACDWIGGIGNGYCDQGNNKPECNYDGGDCCQCTCDPSNADDDGGCDRWSGFACIDPMAPCMDDDSVTVDMIDICGAGSIGNGHCDEENNTPECTYDGGDCCSCTCEPPPGGGDDDACRYGFACLDPSAACVNDDDITVDMLENCHWVAGVGDGYCDPDMNIPECNYDGGDCCECTCEYETPTDDEWDSRFGGCQEFACTDPGAPCVDDDDITVDIFENCGWVGGLGDSHCDTDMNTPECNYDGGDCCECTCEVGPFALTDDDGRYSGCNDFACIDPEAPCVDDDLITIEMIDNCEYVLAVGNGHCNRGNNNELCLYDGGDCCSCTCLSEYDDDYVCSDAFEGFDCKDPAAPCIGEENTTDDIESTDDDFAMSYAMSYEFVPWEQEGPLPTYEGAVEVGVKTEVGVTATAYDVRSGMTSFNVGCGGDGGDGCAPANSRDGIASAVESRWSCATKLVEGGGPCQIEYTFAEPQDIVDIQVAFWKGNERVRTLDVYLNGQKAHTHESYNSGTTFNTLDVVADGVTTVMLESVGLTSEEWVSLIEVLIFVKPDEGLRI